MPPAAAPGPAPHPLALDAASIADALAGRRARGTTTATAAPPPPPPPPAGGAWAALRYDFMPDSLQARGGARAGGANASTSAAAQRGALTLDGEGRVELVRAGGAGGGGVLFAGRRDQGVPARGGLGGGGGGAGVAGPAAASTASGDMVDCVAVFGTGGWTLHALTGGAASLRCVWAFFGEGREGGGRRQRTHARAAADAACTTWWRPASEG